LLLLQKALMLKAYHFLKTILYHPFQQIIDIVNVGQYISHRPISPPVTILYLSSLRWELVRNSNSNKVQNTFSEANTIRYAWFSCWW
jgi:hypothetical protein